MSTESNGNPPRPENGVTEQEREQMRAQIRAYRELSPPPPLTYEQLAELRVAFTRTAPKPQQRPDPPSQQPVA